MASLALLAVGTSAASGAIAQQTRFRLAPGCGSEAEFWQGVRALIGSEAARVQPTEVTITEPNDSGYHTLRIVLDGERRTLLHADCRTLLRSAIVIAAASVRPELGAEQGASEVPAGGAQVEERPARAQNPRRVPRGSPPLARTVRVVRPQRSVAAGWHPVLGGGAGVAFGVVPGASAAFELYAAGVFEGRWGFSVGGRYLTPRDARKDRREVEIHAWGGRVAGLFLPVPRLKLTAGLEADWLPAEGRGIAGGAGSDSAWSLAPFVEVAASPWTSGHMRLELALQGQAAIVRPRFIVTGFGDVYRVPPAGGAGVLRGVWHFF